MTQTTVTGLRMLRRWMVEGISIGFYQVTGYVIRNTGCLVSATIELTANCTQKSGK